MPDILVRYIDVIVLYFPLGLIGVWRWGVWLAKKTVASRYRPIAVQVGYHPTLSVVTPVYNEDPEVFHRALESWRQNGVEEIIAVIDHTDESCITAFKKFAQEFSGAKLIVTAKPGKRSALADGARLTTGEIIALADSDTVWDLDIRDSMVAPFFDKKVGGVTTRQDVMAPQTLAQRLFSIHLDQRYLDEMAYLAVAGHTLTCLSGRTAIYRSKALLPVLKGMESETFLGLPCVSGEDKCLTRLVQANGWHTRYQRHIRVSTYGATKLRTFLKQQVRWIRNSWRSDLKSLRSRWIWRNSKVLALHMVDRFIAPFTLLIGPIYLVLSIYWQNWAAVIVLLVWWHLSRGLKLFAHLRHHPRDVFILPVYIVMTYVIAVLKIYALFTIRRQGWITRWHKSRLKQLTWFKTIPSYIGTTVIIVLLGGLVVSYGNVVRPNSTDIQAKIAGTQNIPTVQVEYAAEEIELKRQTILQSLEDNQLGTLEIRRKDTLSKLSQLLNIRLELVVEANSINIPDPNRVEIGDKVIIPIKELRNPISRELLQTAPEPTIIHVPEENTVYLTGHGSAIDIPTLAARLSNPALLDQTAPGQWTLRTSIFLREGATLIIAGDEVQWLKIKSQDENFAWIRAYHANILIQDTKITSWNENTNNFDLTYKEDGRSYLLVKYNGRMDVLNSEIAYLGYGIDEGWGETNRHAGGVYGLSWKIIDESFGKYIVTGVVLNNKIHHNYYGFYTYGATGIIAQNNEVYANVQYGLDPHDDSNNLIIENNIVYDNGNHGIILSKRCFNNIIRYNTSYNNGLHGIMLDRQSNNNLVEDNVIYGNTDGITLFDSHNNLVQNNEIRDNKNGIRANVNSSDNIFAGNIILNGQRGIYLYQGARDNVIFNNTISFNEVGVRLKDAADNIVVQSLYAGQNTRSTQETGNSTGNQIEIIR